jgi:hypothetical protein
MAVTYSWPPWLSESYHPRRGGLKLEAPTGIHPIATSKKQLLNMIGNLV